MSSGVSLDCDSVIYPFLEDRMTGRHLAGHDAEGTFPFFDLLEASDDRPEKLILCFHISDVIKGEDDGCLNAWLSYPHWGGQFWKSRMRIINKRCFEIDELVSVQTLLRGTNPTCAG